jgi:pyruvate/2-oxoglutarate dehydrogenase complex dihydrolipoamide dehydrogenase (E3) component
VGCELAQAFARLGSQVTLFAKGSTVLPREDSDAARRVAAALTADGVTIVDADGVRIDAAWNTIHHTGGPVSFDRILVATGRAPTVHGLGLEAAGVAFDERTGVQVDDRLRTTNRRIYAVGDVATTQRFTHAADAMARLVVRNALFAGRGRFSRLVIPRCTYTDPEVAAIGLTNADTATVPLTAFTVTLRDLDRAVLEGDTDGFVKVFVKSGTDRIVGATIVAPRAGEMIGEVALAMTVKTGLRRLGETVHPYPTFGEALRKAGDAYNRSRLTPLVRRVLGWWLRW